MQRDLFEKAPIPKAYLKLSVPVVLSMVLGVVYNMVDTWFISLTGDANLVAGVSICAPIFVLSIAMGDIWGLGGSSLMARLLGKREDDQAGGVSAFCLYAAFGTGLVFMLLMLLFRDPILQLLGANADSLPHATGYLTWIALGTPFIILSMIPSNQLRTEGLSSLGMWGAVAGSVANILLDPLFIFTLKMGAAGAALATSLSNLLSCALYALMIRKKCKVMTLNIRKARIPRKHIGEVLRIGIPASVTNIMNSLSIMLTNRALAAYGNERIAAMGIAMKINMICTMVLIGFAFGAQPLFGYTHGGRHDLRFRKALRFAYLFEAGIGFGFAVILYFLAPSLMRLFMSDPQVIEAGTGILRYMQLSSLLMGISLVSVCVCQAVGYASGALILSLSRQGILFFLCITVLSSLLGFTGILLAQPASDFLTGILALFLVSGILRKLGNEKNGGERTAS
ncbi:MAG: MATE family efflux transporter [Clostridiales bacterium]|nr:MATE family efflux transporter [Clostridiales bacterium]